jgi:hypothetical protein
VFQLLLAFQDMNESESWEMPISHPEGKKESRNSEHESSEERFPFLFSTDADRGAVLRTA